MARNKQQMNRWRKHAVTQTQSSGKSVQRLDRVVIRFAGDSGDGMQLTGDRFTSETAALGNDLSTLPNFPAEIRAPQGTLPGVSSFQLHFADHDVLTPGDAPDVLVAMNPAALKANLRDLPRGATIIANTDEFSKRNLAKVGYDTNPIEDGSLESWHVHPVALTSITVEALAAFDTLSRKDKERAKNMFALGLLSWMYHRPTTGTERFLEKKFGSKPDILAANLAALKAGLNYGETTEDFAVSYEIAPAKMAPGTYRNITGNAALALGLVTASHRAGIPLVLGSYPITPASDILHTLAGTQALRRDDPAGRGRDLRHRRGARRLVRWRHRRHHHLRPRASRSSPRRSGSGVSLELPLVIVDVQRGGPSTGLPTKTEQSDLLQAMFGRNGESPVPIIAPQSPGRLLRRRARGGADRDHLPHAGVPALRRLPRQRLRAVVGPVGGRAARPDRVSSPPSRTTPTTRASRSSTRSCATRPPSRAPGPSPARPASSTASAASRRPTSPATSPTTPTTTT